MQISITQFLRDHVTGDHRADGAVGEALVIPLSERGTAARTGARITRSFDRIEKLIGGSNVRAWKRPVEKSHARERSGARGARRVRTHGGGPGSGGASLLGIAAGAVAALAINALTDAHGSILGAVRNATASTVGIGRRLLTDAVHGIARAARAGAGAIGDATNATMQGVTSTWRRVAGGTGALADTHAEGSRAVAERAEDPSMQWHEEQPPLHDELPNTRDATMQGVDAFWTRAIATVRKWLLGAFDGTSNDFGDGRAPTPGSGPGGQTPGTGGGDTSPGGGGGQTPEARGRGVRSGDRDDEPVPPPGAEGQYRPQYKLSDADLSDDVVRTIANEATSGRASTDAVINSMFNRLGSRGYGPSNNLRSIALAPGQYAGSQVARMPSAARAAEIRERIKAVASGAVPDITHGANEFRAGSYAGRWARRHAQDGEVIGGNRFAKNPRATSPYAPYDVPHDPPPSTKTAPGEDATAKAEQSRAPIVPGSAVVHDDGASSSTSPRASTTSNTSSGTERDVVDTATPRATMPPSVRRDDDAAPSPAPTRRPAPAPAVSERSDDAPQRSAYNDDDSDAHRHRRLVPRHVHDAGAGLLVVGSSAYT